MSDVILRQAAGDHAPDPDARSLTAQELDWKVKLDGVWAAWAKDARANSNIVERSHPVLDRMMDFAGINDLGEALLQD